MKNLILNLIKEYDSYSIGTSDPSCVRICEMEMEKVYFFCLVKYS